MKGAQGKMRGEGKGRKGGGIKQVSILEIRGGAGMLPSHTVSNKGVRGNTVCEGEG